MSAKILQINFGLKASAAEYQSLCQSVAQTVADTPGLRWKVWLLNEREKEAGGIYLFESEQALNSYLSSPLIAQVKSHPGLRDLSAKVFDIQEEMTAVTRGPITAMAAAS